MAFKEYSKNMSFLDMELARILGVSRTQKLLNEINKHIDWRPIEEILVKGYPVGKSSVGNAAYPPLMLLKALLLQKWFGIKSDPELENQLNDRISFRIFIGLPFSDMAPDHSVICRFRDRVGDKTVAAVHNALLRQFKALGFSLESGMAVDARLIKSASHPVSSEKLEALKEDKEEKTDTSVKFSRDIESDWTIKNDEPHFGMKEHASIDVESGLVLSTLISKASEHDTNYFQAVIIKSLHGDSLPSRVYADKGYCSGLNRVFLNDNNIADGIMRKNLINARLTDFEIQRNKLISKVRYKIGQYFGLTELHQGAGKARFTTLAKQGWDNLCGVMAFNIKRVTLVMQKQPVPMTI